jgi:hypothetical protein
MKGETGGSVLEPTSAALHNSEEMFVWVFLALLDASPRFDAPFSP